MVVDSGHVAGLERKVVPSTWYDVIYADCLACGTSELLYREFPSGSIALPIALQHRLMKDV